jgi:hypothetical protein
MITKGKTSSNAALLLVVRIGFFTCHMVSGAESSFIYTDIVFTLRWLKVYQFEEINLHVSQAHGKDCYILIQIL